MNKLYKYVSVILMLGLLVGCGASFGTTEQIVDIETPLATESQLPERPETLLELQSLLQTTDESCQLPCFWGFRINHSTEAEVLEFVQSQAIGNNPPPLIYRFPEDSEQDSLFWLSFGTRNNIVTEIAVTIHNPSEWLPAETLELPHLLSIMPSTPQAYLSINITTGLIFLTLAYDEGIYAQYVLELHTNGHVTSRNIDEPFLFCPTLDVSISFTFADADAQTLLENNGTLPEVFSDHIWTVEHMTGMTIEEFMQRIIENPDSCIELPSYPDLLEMGYEF